MADPFSFAPAPMRMAMRSLPQSPNIEDRRGQFTLADLMALVNTASARDVPVDEEAPPPMQSVAGPFEDDISETRKRIVMGGMLERMLQGQQLQQQLEAYAKSGNPNVAGPIPVVDRKR